LFYFDGETALAACVLWATAKKGQLFLRKKVHPGDLAGGFSDLEMTCSFTALAPPLPVARRLFLDSVCLFTCLFATSHKLLIGTL